MKTLLLTISLTLTPAISQPMCECITAQCRTIKMLNDIELKLKRNTNPKAIQPKILAPVILKLSKAKGIDPLLVIRIIVIESHGIPDAYNKRSNDYGIMQINGSTAKAYGISKNCLMNWRCNIRAGVRILADLQKHNGFRACMYNLGPKGKFKKHLMLCEKYERKLASIN